MGGISLWLLPTLLWKHMDRKTMWMGPNDAQRNEMNTNIVGTINVEPSSKFCVYAIHSPKEVLSFELSRLFTCYTEYMCKLSLHKYKCL